MSPKCWSQDSNRSAHLQTTPSSFLRTIPPPMLLNRQLNSPPWKVSQWKPNPCPAKIKSSSVKSDPVGMGACSASVVLALWLSYFDDLCARWLNIPGQSWFKHTWSRQSVGLTLCWNWGQRGCWSKGLSLTQKPYALIQTAHFTGTNISGLSINFSGSPFSL